MGYAARREARPVRELLAEHRRQRVGTIIAWMFAHPAAAFWIMIAGLPLCLVRAIVPAIVRAGVQSVRDWYHDTHVFYQLAREAIERHEPRA